MLPKDEEVFLRRCLTLARRGTQTVSPNPAVGSVIVKKGDIIAEGWHMKPGEEHAERAALKLAGKEAAGADLYVSLEPCCHHGRTPPCTDAVIQAGIRRVVACSIDPNPRVNGRGFELLQKAGIEVSHGFLLDEAEKLNEVYFHYIRHGTPFVHVKAGMSMDGRIATRSGKSQWITGEQALHYAHTLRQRYDAILVGRGTIQQDDPRLNVRIEGGGSIHRILVDTRLSTSPDATVFRSDAGKEVIVATSDKATENRINKIQSTGAEVLILPETNRGIDLTALMDKLGRRAITSLMVEGGGEIIASFFEAGLVHKVTFVLAPMIIGGRASIPVVAGREIDNLSDAWRLKDMRSFSLGADIAIEAYPVYHVAEEQA